MVLQVKKVIKDKGVNSQPYYKNYFKGWYNLQVQRTIVCIFHIPIISWEKVIKYDGYKTYFG